MKMIIRDENGETETTLKEFITNLMNGSYYMGHAEGLVHEPSRKPHPPEGEFVIEGDCIVQDKR